MTTLEIIRAGNTWSLHDLTGDIQWVGDDGWGAPDVEIITDRGPGQHGDSDTDVLLQPRVGMLKLRAKAESASDHWDIRSTLLRAFRPTRLITNLRWTLDNGSVRQIDVKFAGGLKFGSGERVGFTQFAVVALRASDPTFYDPTPQSVVFGVGGGSGTFAVPLAVPVAVGASTISQTTTITYPGTWRTYPVVTITGPLTNAVITNAATGDKLDFTGTTINAGDSRTIDCRPGKKTVVDAAGASQIDEPTDDSDLQTFSLEADEEAPGGNNAITVTGSGATSATQVAIVYYIRYIGL